MCGGGGGGQSDPRLDSPSGDDVMFVSVVILLHAARVPLTRGQGEGGGRRQC